jgi:hypothetical protein
MVVLWRLLARRADRRFGSDLQNNLILLFTEKGAQIVPNEASDYWEPRQFGLEVATVATPELYLRFVRVRGEFSASIALPAEKPRWEGIGSALVWLDMQERRTSELPKWDCGLGTDPDWAAVDHFWWTIGTA